MPPNEPIINSHYGYATITPYNIIEDGGTTIIYDNSVSGTKNYYSLDDGVTWYEYNGKISISKYGNIMAKSVKPNGLETIVTKSIEAPSDALPEVCYDGDKGTYNELSSDNGTFAYWSSESKRIYVEDAPISVCVKYTNHQYCKITFNYYNDSDEKIDSVNLDAATWSYSEQILEIPENTAYIDIDMTQWSQSGKIASNCIYEIYLNNAPDISVNYSYPTITATGMEVLNYNEIEIKYNETSTQKLYKINDSDWKEYTGKINLNYDDVIYAKGINKEGIESENSSYTSKMADDILDPVCYNGDTGTYDGLSSDNGTFSYWSSGNKRINVSGAPININVYYTSHQYRKITFDYYNSNNENIDSKTLTAATWKLAQQAIEIPENTAYIYITMTQWSQSGKVASNCIYEIEVVQ